MASVTYSLVYATLDAEPTCYELMFSFIIRSSMITYIVGCETPRAHNLNLLENLRHVYVPFSIRAAAAHIINYTEQLYGNRRHLETS